MIFFSTGTEPLTIIATAPVMVVQFGLGRFYDNVYGNPFMTTVPALSNYANDYIFPSPSHLDNVQVINTVAITIKRRDVDGLRLNGQPLQVQSQTLKVKSLSIKAYNTKGKHLATIIQHERDKQNMFHSKVKDSQIKHKNM